MLPTEKHTQNRRARGGERAPNRRRRAIVFVAVLAMLISACGDGETDAETTTTQAEEGASTTEQGSATTEVTTELPSDDVLSFGLSNTVETLDPYANFDCPVWTSSAPIYNGLLRYVDGELEGDLASNWEYVEPTTLRVEIVPDVTFHDGSPFEAKDVIATFEKAMADESVGFDSSMLAAVENVEAIDEHTVEFHLSQPSAYLLHALPHMKILPADRPEGFGQNPIGTGPFMLESINPGVGHNLVANPNYFRGVPELGGISFEYLPDDDARTNALQSGSVQMMDYVPWHYIERMEQAGFQLPTNRAALGLNLVFNVNIEPFDDPLVRQGVAYAIDRDALQQSVMFGTGATITGGWIPEGREGYAPELEGTYTRDLNRATELLEEAGALGLETPAELVTSSTFAFHEQMATIIQDNLSEVGFSVEINAVEQATYADMRAASAFDLLTLTERGVNPSMAFGTYLSDGPNNRGNYDNAEVDSRIGEINATLDDQEREELLIELQRLLLEDMPVIPLVWRDQFDGLAGNISGYPSQVGYRCNGEGMETVRVGN